MLKIDSYSLKGTKTGEITLPKEFDVPENPSLLAQAIKVYEERDHVGLRQAKTRSEVNRTTKKVYKQKGTGGARHGSRRANVFVGGGVVFGPRALRRQVTLPTALKSKAKMLAFCHKTKEKKMLALTGISKVQKTKTAHEFLKKLTTKTNANKFTFVLSDKNHKVSLFLRNLTDAQTVFYKEVNAFDIFKGEMIVLDADIFEKEKITKTEKKGSKGL